MDDEVGQKPRRLKLLRELGGCIVAALLAVVIGLFFRSWLVQDFWRGLWYQPSEKVAAIESALELTSTGKRILSATHPVIEDREAFNEHCDSHKTEISLLGCYTEGNIYVYEITTEALADSNKVTMAHELLHAAWARMGESEHENIIKLLEQVQDDNADWFESELAVYNDSEKMEEVYTRAGTKLRDLPEELERHYANYFVDRAKIVTFYENYQAPFLALEEESEKLRETILQVKAEIMAERAEYLRQAELLDDEIKKFNECAEQIGCFTEETFQSGRAKLLQWGEVLDQEREKLNQKIDENNARVAAYDEKQIALGKLNDAMNSNAEERQE